MTGVELIAQERKEQIEKHKWDDKNNIAVRLELAATFALTLDYSYYPEGWGMWWYEKMKTKSVEERIKIAGALCAAALDKLNSEK